MTLFTRISSQALRNGVKRSHGIQQQSNRRMAGASHYLHISESHTQAGEIFGVICWLWVFHRARHDLPVVLGFRHPWEHAGGDHDHGHHHGSHGEHSLNEKWDKHTTRALNFLSEDDDDEDEEVEEEEAEEDEEE